MTEPTDANAGEAEAPQETALPPAAAPDYEGPRRRARREREERRAAQARATAIEHARREAKRRVIGSPPTRRKGLARRTVRGLKVLMWTALVSVLVVGLGLLLYFTPIMSARNIVIIGLGAVTQEEVIAAAAVKQGTPLLQVEHGRRRRAGGHDPPGRQRAGAARIPVDASDHGRRAGARRRQGLSRTVHTCSTATAWTSRPRRRLPNLPYLDTDNPGPSDPPTKAALEVMTALRPEVAGQVARVSAPSVAAITLTLVDGREVVWGTTERTEEKAQKLAALLTQPGHTYDVSSPDLPTVK